MNDWKEKLDEIKDVIPKEEKLKWIDTHAHYDHGKFKGRKDKVLEEIKKDVEYIIDLGVNVKSNNSTIKIIERYGFIYGMVGFFPTDVMELEDPNVKANFINSLNHPKIVGIGEIGLDYNWDKVNCKDREIAGNEARDLQKKWLIYQMDLAESLDLPVSIHSRDAEEDTRLIFNRYDSIKGVVHCFSYGRKSAEFYLNKGLYLGIGGTSTYKGNDELREVIKMAPLDRLLLETDAPYLSPEPVRRTINTSSNIIYVIKNIANLKGISEEEVIRQTNENAKKLFNLK